MDIVRRALVVDDDTVSRLVLAHMLRRAGWEVVEADDIGPATVLAVSAGVSVIFCDYWLPAGNGLEVLSVLGKGDSRPLFVLVTGMVEHADIELESGEKVDWHLTKPINTRSLNECLAAILSRRATG